MTDKEKLEKVRAEIERRKKEVIDNIFELGNSESERIGLFDRKEIYDDLLSFIDSMEKEPVSEDLKEEIGKYCSNPENFITYIDVGFKQSPIEKDDIPLIIKAIEFGANWQKQKDNYAIEIAHMAGVEEGKNIMKQQMMAKAVDTTIKQGCTDLGILIKGLDEDKFSFGDKIKVLIIKED